uniref:Uncharacterized protein n=1 Tax=Oryza brachyantha TaxID=4533 RepID=J3L5K3_ORYBR
METSSNPPVKRCLSKTPSRNPLPRRGQVKENMGRQIVAAAAARAPPAAPPLSGNRGGGGGGGAAAGGNKKGIGNPAPVAGAKKK